MSVSSPYDTLQPTAPQEIINQLLIPGQVGGSLAVFLSGAATAIALPELGGKHAIPFSRTLLAIAVVANLINSAFYQWNGVAYAVSQDRSLGALMSFKIQEIVGPTFAMLAATAVQTFMAIRCWLLIQRNMAFAVISGLSIAAALAVGVWGLAVYLIFHEGRLPVSAIGPPSIVYLSLSAFADLVIVVVLSYTLMELRKSNGQRSAFVLSNLIKLSFETFIAPFLIIVLGIAFKCATRNTAWLFNLWAAIMPSVSAAYIISFVYCLKASAVVRNKTRALSPTSFTVRDGQVVRHSMRTPQGDLTFLEQVSPSSVNHGRSSDIVGISQMFRTSPRRTTRADTPKPDLPASSEPTDEEKFEGPDLATDNSLSTLDKSVVLPPFAEASEKVACPGEAVGESEGRS